MIREDIPLYKLDLEGNSTFNKVTREFMFRRKVKNNSIVIPSKGPFYQKSMRLFDMAGQPLVEGTHYEFYGIMSKITQFTGKPVGLYIRLLDDTILEWYATYQVVGNFSKISNEILNMLKSIHEDDRFVLWENIENKPLWFIPEIHQHDLAYDIYAFTDLARELNRLAEIQGAMTSAQDFMVETLKNNLAVYIDGYKKVLMDLLNSHIGNKHDAHGTDAKAIGLGNVQNIPSATLEETLEGLRDDLTLTPYNSFLAVKAAAGRNERLYPSGTLPILRYGSDTFIPPTIDGSFEGLGGLSRRCGMIVETDGTLLILNHRNNGKIRGLYFTRCSDWRSQQANYEFTAYQYQHPTATAAGATLDTVINGSNRYIMVVGDSVKNMWWWCETHGTFDPAKHILVPLSGKWVTEDMGTTDPAAAWWDHPWKKSVVLADKNYKEHFSIVQPYTYSEFHRRFPNYAPEISQYRLGAITNYCYSINVVTQRNGVIERAKVNYTNPVLGDTTSEYWFPWSIEVVDAPDLPYGKGISKCFADFSEPSPFIWMYRSVHAMWLSSDVPDEYVTRLEMNGMVTGPKTGGNGSWYLAWRGKFKISKDTSGTVVDITNAPSSDKLYNINPDQPWEGILEFDQFRANVVSEIIVNGADSVGSAVLSPGIFGFADGTSNVTFPSRYAMANVGYAENANALFNPPHTQPGGSWIYQSLNKTVIESNPIGLSTLFENQAMGIGDTDNYQMGGVYARQNLGSGYEWVFRPLSNLNANYAEVPPPLVGNYQGVVYSNYPFKPEAYKTSIGAQVMLCSALTIDGINNKAMYKSVMGVSADTTMLGSKVGATTDTPNGDGMWVKEVDIKLTNGKVTFTPVVVINVLSGIANNLTQLMASAGLTADEVKKTWTIGRVLGGDGNVYSIAQCFATRGKDVLTVTMFIDINPTGTPDTSKGYTYYADATIVQRSPPVTVLSGFDIANTSVGYPDYTSGSDQNPRCISIPFKAKNGDVYDRSGTYIALMNGPCFHARAGRSRPNMSISANANCTVINEMYHLGALMWGMDTGYTACPYYGIGDATAGMLTFEGAAIACETYRQDGNFYDNIKRKLKTDKRVIGMSNILTPQYTVYFQEMKNVMLAGRMYNIPATHIDILDQDPNPANKTFYIYLYYTSGLAKYIISDTVRPESASQSLIATVYCGPTQIDRIIPYNRFSIDGASFSAVRQGSSILASSGSVYDTGETSTILKPSDYIP